MKLFVIGGSAGALQVILEALPNIKIDLSFPILIVLHRKTDPRSVLEEVLAAKTKIKIKEVDDKETLVNGVIYLAPADYHTFIESDYSFSLDFSEKVHYTRPSVDVTLQSAADVFGSNLYAVLLSGANQDGAEGALTAQNKGATIWVQDPLTADIPIMPLSALTATNATTFTPAELASIINSVNQ